MLEPREGGLISIDLMLGVMHDHELRRIRESLDVDRTTFGWSVINEHYCPANTVRHADAVIPARDGQKAVSRRAQRSETRDPACVGVEGEKLAARCGAKRMKQRRRVVPGSQLKNRSGARNRHCGGQCWFVRTPQAICSAIEVAQRNTRTASVASMARLTLMATC